VLLCFFRFRDTSEAPGVKGSAVRVSPDQIELLLVHKDRQGLEPQPRGFASEPGVLHVEPPTLQHGAHSRFQNHRLVPDQRIAASRREVKSAVKVVDRNRLARTRCDEGKCITHSLLVSRSLEKVREPSCHSARNNGFVRRRIEQELLRELQAVSSEPDTAHPLKFIVITSRLRLPNACHSRNGCYVETFALEEFIHDIHEARELSVSACFPIGTRHP
jgi:hypothetical protein